MQRGLVAPFSPSAEAQTLVWRSPNLIGRQELGIEVRFPSKSK